MSNFPDDLQTPMTILMKKLDEAGLCVPLNQVAPSTRAASVSLKAIDEAIWAAIPLFKAWQVDHNFAPAKLSSVLDELSAAAAALTRAHEQAMMIAHDKKIKVNDGGGK